MSTSILGGFALSAFIAATPMDQAYANPESEAVKQLSKALYKEYDVDKYVKQLEQRYLSEEFIKYGGAVGVGVRIITEQKVSYTWEF